MSEFKYGFDNNPWANDYFKAPALQPGEQTTGPTPSVFRDKARRKPIPDQREVFTIQKALVRTLEGLSDIERENESLDTTKVRRDLESAYRKLNRYLDQFSQ